MLSKCLGWSNLGVVYSQSAETHETSIGRSCCVHKLGLCMLLGKTATFKGMLPELERCDLHEQVLMCSSNFCF